jgi:putative ABC transport system substrate-binding protein
MPALGSLQGLRVDSLVAAGDGFNRLPEVGLFTFEAQDGLLSAVGVSGYKTGVYVGLRGAEILQGADPGQMPIGTPSASDIYVNLARAKMLGVEIPITQLMGAAGVYHTMTKVTP